MIDFSGKRILCVSAHLDDVEIGCGGLVARYADRAEIYVMGLSLYRRAYHGEIQEERNVEEQLKALDALGVPRDHFLSNSEIAGQMLPEYRQLVLEELYRADRETRPDLVLVPSINDVHQDHRTVARSALKAFKRTSVWGYEVINSATGYSPNLYVGLSEDDVRLKSEAVSCFESQHATDNTTGDYFSHEIIRSLAVVRGARAGCGLAEAFETYLMRA